MRDLGYLEGQHFKMEDRNANGDLERLPALAAELANLPVDILIAGGEAPIRAAKHANERNPDRHGDRRRSGRQRIDP
jgi:putative ABC transport system substrate-binding protein